MCTAVTDQGPLSKTRFSDFTSATCISDHLTLQVSSELDTQVTTQYFLPL